MEAAIGALWTLSCVITGGFPRQPRHQGSKVASYRVVKVSMVFCISGIVIMVLGRCLIVGYLDP